MTAAPSVDLYWLPLGAGGHLVRWNGRIYEAFSAMLEHRARASFYHPALIVSLPPHAYVIEQTPVVGMPRVDRGVVAQGPVGVRWAGRRPIFRYEVHCWDGGTIADIGEAVASLFRVSSSEATCRELLEIVSSIPVPVWGRDELGTGEMWNSNSVVAWLLATSGIDSHSISPPAGGSAPGWSAGVHVARRPSAAEQT